MPTESVDAVAAAAEQTPLSDDSDEEQCSEEEKEDATYLRGSRPTLVRQNTMNSVRDLFFGHGFRRGGRRTKKSSLETDMNDEKHDPSSSSWADVDADTITVAITPLN